MRVLTFVVGLAFADEGSLDRELVEADLRNAVEEAFTDGRDRGYGAARVTDVDVTPTSSLSGGVA